MEETIFLNNHKFLDKLHRKVEKIRLSLKSGNLFKRIINYFLVKLSLWLRSPTVWGYPFYLLIEPTNVCNLKCPLCPTGEGTLNRESGFMEWAVFKAVIDEIGDYLLELNITNYGEPFLHNQLCEMISYVKRKGIKVFVGTNGHYFGDEAKIKKIILSGLDGIYVSLDGIDQDTYSRYRIGGNFNKVVKGLELLVKVRKQLRRRLPFIELQFLVMQHNESHIPEIRRIARQIGVDRLVLKPVSFNVSEWYKENIQEIFNRFFPSNEKFRLYRLVEQKLEWKKPIENRCDYLWRGIVILWDGTIVPCCLDPRAEYKIGHVKDGIKRIWNSSKYVSLRKQILKNKKKLSLCSNCPGT